MSTRYYPLYQRGNPHLRVFLPNFWMKLIRSEEPLPPNQVLFQTSIEMTKYDVKNYLEKIYKVPVVEVRTTIKMGEIRRNPVKFNLTKDDDYKEALVTLPKNTVFEFPDLFPKKERSTEDSKDLEEFKKEMKKKNQNTFGIPKWFTG